MSTSTNHFASAFKNNCVVRPRKSNTELPITDLESSFSHSKTTAYNDQTNEDFGANRRGQREEMKQNDSTSHIRTAKSQMYEISDLPNLLQSDDKFYKHLQELRCENKKTLKMLEKFYRPVTQANEDKYSHMKPADFIERMKQDQEIENNSKFVNNLYDSIAYGGLEKDDNAEYLRNGKFSQEYDSNSYSSVDYKANASYESSDEDEEDPRKDWPRKFSHNILPDESADIFRGRSSSYEVIDNMWDNFSVDSYAPPDQTKKVNYSDSGKKEWSPSITIPEPFKMTLRTAAKAKVKSKRKEKLEQELLKKRLEEEAELNKKFRAKPAPATTFLQIYKENEKKEQEKREYRRSLNKAILEATQKPFEFIKREEKKKELRRSLSVDGLDKNNEYETEFKAAPFPFELFNLSLEDKRAEQEEYRKIKIKMRSQETLSKSSLPPNMRARGEHYTINNRYTKEKSNKKLSNSETFRPNINHEIPDYEDLQKKFERELQEKRRQATPTICQPFDLHTAKVPSRKSSKTKQKNEESYTASLKCLQRSTPEIKSYVKKDYRLSTPQLKSSFNDSGSDDPPPFALTETARRRHSKTRQSLTNRVRAEEEERKQAEQKKRRQNEIRKQVARKSAANDLKFILQKQSKDKLQSFRESDHARAREYRQYLKDLKARVEERPLLFERESQTNAKKAAQRKYRQILQESGVADYVVDSLITEDGQIIDAESDEDFMSDDNEAKDSLLLVDRNEANDSTFIVDESEDTLHNADDVTDAEDASEEEQSL